MDFKNVLSKKRKNGKEKKGKGTERDEKKCKKSSYYNGLQDYIFKEFNLYSFESFIKFLYRPTCPTSLGVVRALFGLMMIIDIPDERGLANIDSKFGDPMRCHFPLFDWLTPFPFEYMGLLYGIMWLGAFGICFGYKFHSSCLMFIFPYWYIYLLDKSAWNNHSYLYGLVSILFTFSSANHSFSLDALLNPGIKNKPVPLWNYAIIRFQFFLLYFYAGVKKFDSDWIGGHSMTRLSLHWVFDPFRFVLNNEQIDFWIIHIFGFLFDLTVGFLFLIDKTRAVAILFSVAFHLMNSCMFFIGQFPYVCLVTTPIFCAYDWPNQLINYVKKSIGLSEKASIDKLEERIKTTTIKKNVNDEIIYWKHKLTFYMLVAYIGVQLFLPFSHFITQGYNNWTNGLYGYSWDMMVQNWSAELTVIKVVDNNSKEEFFLDPEAWVGNSRHTKHGDMLVQYAKCLKRNLNNPLIRRRLNIHSKSDLSNISVYIDVWSSLNGRFQQRMFDPKQDLLTAEWNPFKKITWLMPLLSELTHWRKNIADIQKEVFQWSNYSDVLFIADFPGLYLEHYIGFDFTNVTLTVLQGIIILEQSTYINKIGVENITLFKGGSHSIKEGLFHKVYTISEEPSCYMYTFNNQSMAKLNVSGPGEKSLSTSVIYEMMMKQMTTRIKNFFKSLLLLQTCLNKIFFNIPLPLKTV